MELARSMSREEEKVLEAHKDNPAVHKRVMEIITMCKTHEGNEVTLDP